MSIDELHEHCIELGRAAFERGIKALPILDPAVIHLIERHNEQDASLAILKGWTKGWHTANLEAPVC